jgi:plasmid stability protein
MTGRKNLTLALDEDWIIKARILAARRGTSVTKLVRQSLAHMVSGDQEKIQANTRLKALMHKPRLKIGKARWIRDEIHERTALQWEPWLL